MDRLHEGRFRASMLGLGVGDVIVCERDGEELRSVVLKRREERGRVLLTISRFSLPLSFQAHPKEVFWDAPYNFLSDTGGQIMLLLEEWGGTDKGRTELF